MYIQGVGDQVRRYFCKVHGHKTSEVLVHPGRMLCLSFINGSKRVADLRGVFGMEALYNLPVLNKRLASNVDGPSTLPIWAI